MVDYSTNAGYDNGMDYKSDAARNKQTTSVKKAVSCGAGCNPCTYCR